MLAWLCLLFALPALAQPLQLQIQRDQMSLGETLGVVVSSDIGLDLNQLDLSPLQRDFEVLGRSSGTQISMVNGTTTRTSTLELQLRPLREGRLQLPALQLDGQQTQPAVVDVVPTPVSGDQLDPQQDFMILLEADSEQPYVQQQITLTVRLYYGVALSDGSLSEPSSDSAVVSRIGRDEIYASQVGGRNYQVLQRRYAVIPQ
ncbi:MAG: BatD family protein, partial [Xanthomonadales bacterium]|nr:BatD family protein [Xanthomonadales bacterium]